MGITYKGGTQSTNQLHAYADASFASHSNAKSITGFVVMFNQGPIAWKSQQQKRTALSTAEAEYAATSECARQVIHQQQVIQDLKNVLQLPTIIQTDNQAAIFIATNTVISDKVKHVDKYIHFIKDIIVEKLIDIKFIPTADNTADCLTKSLERLLFTRHRNGLGITEARGPGEC